MSSISLFTIEGTIQPGLHHASCGAEASAPLPAPVFHIQRSQLEPSETLILSEHFEDYFNEDDPVFWKQRSIIHMLVSSHILSMTFIPYEVAKCQTLFVQKRNLLNTITGFIAPYLCLEDQQKLGATATVSSYHSLWGEGSINGSLRGLEHCSEELRPLLKYFLNDRTTCFLGITCLSEESGIPISRGWIKA